ncbi:uncharacterized protein LOC131663453 [Phymastichus coffea]|uniref:uncharacterized protein LOC131663453 n=1 Tax=Phymastichus coffea TaxID=108790 RepID=UPI00273A81CE|nr:uncharacterized protein LOC131663453 [Phymastichus coffea]
MENQNNDDLEEQCEDTVYKICCTREHYSARCAKYFEKYLGLVTKKQTAKVQVNLVSDFVQPAITERQQKLYHDFISESKTHQSKKKDDAREILTRIKELKSILNQIERSKKSEFQQLLMD